MDVTSHQIIIIIYIITFISYIFIFDVANQNQVMKSILNMVKCELSLGNVEQRRN